MEVRIIEITVSYDPKAKERKASKYALLIHFLRKQGLSVKYDIIVFHPDNVYVNRGELIDLGLSDLSLDFVNRVCQQTSKLLAKIHERPEGELWWRRFNNRDTIVSDFK